MAGDDSLPHTEPLMILTSMGFVAVLMPAPTGDLQSVESCRSRMRLLAARPNHDFSEEEALDRAYCTKIIGADFTAPEDYLAEKLSKSHSPRASVQGWMFEHWPEPRAVNEVKVLQDYLVGIVDEYPCESSDGPDRLQYLAALADVMKRSAAAERLDRCARQIAVQVGPRSDQGTSPGAPVTQAQGLSELGETRKTAPRGPVSHVPRPDPLPVLIVPPRPTQGERAALGIAIVTTLGAVALGGGGSYFMIHTRASGPVVTTLNSGLMRLGINASTPGQDCKYVDERASEAGYSRAAELCDEYGDGRRNGWGLSGAAIASAVVAVVLFPVYQSLRERRTKKIPKVGGSSVWGGHTLWLRWEF